MLWRPLRIYQFLDRCARAGVPDFHHSGTRATCGQPFSVGAEREETVSAVVAAQARLSELPHGLGFKDASVIAMKDCENLAVLRNGGMLPRSRRSGGFRRADAEFAHPAGGPHRPQKQSALTAHQQAAAAFLKARA